MKRFFERSDSSENKGEGTAKPVDARSLHEPSSSGDTRGTSPEQEWQKQHFTGNANFNSCLRNANGDLLAALRSFQQKSKSEMDIALETFDNSFVELLDSVKDPVTKTRLKQQLDTIRRQLEADPNPGKVFKYAMDKMKQEKTPSDPESFFNRIEGNINQYWLEEYDRNRGRS